MQSHSLSTVAFLLTGLVLLASLAGCDRCNSSAEEELPWRFISDDVPYEIIFPPEWSLEPQGAINPHADMAASRDNTFFFMVIPQQLPSFPDPDVFDLKRAALEMLDDSVENLVIERQGPLTLDEVSGLTVFARGELDGESISYITSYVIHEDVGYQIIAFTEEEQAAILFEETDAILSMWSFSEVPSAPHKPATVLDENSDTSASGALPNLEDP